MTLAHKEKPVLGEALQKKANELLARALKEPGVADALAAYEQVHSASKAAQACLDVMKLVPVRSQMSDSTSPVPTSR